MEIIVEDGLTIVGDNAEKLKESKNFWRWLDSMRSNVVKIRRIEEKWSLWRDSILVFALFYVNYLDEGKQERTNVIFCRSDAVAVLLILKDKDTGIRYVALVQQMRVPAGQILLEIPAGCVEGDDDLLETAVREIKEEITLEITQKDLEFLGQYFFSPGACNEKITLYSCERELTGSEIRLMADRLTGLKEEGENIKVKLYEIGLFHHLGIRDAKSILAYELYLQRGRR